MSDMLQECQGNDDWESRAVQESAEYASSDEAKVFEDIIAQSRKEAEEKAHKEEEEQLNQILELSKNDVPKGDFACEEDEEAYIARLRQWTRREYLDVQKALGAVADDDYRTLDEVTHRSMKDYHKMTWDNEPPPEDVWIGREKVDESGKENGKGKGTEQCSFTQQQYYSVQQGFQSMSVSQSGFSAGGSLNSVSGWRIPGYCGYPQPRCASPPPQQAPLPSIIPSSPHGEPSLSAHTTLPQDSNTHTFQPSNYPISGNDAQPVSSPHLPPSAAANLNKPCPPIQDCAKQTRDTDSKLAESTAETTVEGNKDEEIEKTDDPADISGNKNFLKSKHVTFLDQVEKKE